MQHKISVLVLQYNAEYEKLILTLQSIVNQSIDSYEIVIADDGSKDNHFAELEEYFTTVSFQNYRLVENKENQGTVKNIISGLEKCSGKYVKLISPGDCLYCKETLANVYHEMEKAKVEFAFGKLAFYRMEEELIVYDETRPYSLDPYIEGDVETIKRHLVLYQDNISGASAFVERELMCTLMKLIEDKVVFQEDVVFALLPYMQKKIHFMNQYVVWYENKVGISTSKNKVWIDRLHKDSESFYRLLRGMYPEDEMIGKAFFLVKLARSESFVKKVLKSILSPRKFAYTHTNKYRKIVGDLPDKNLFIK